jgi:hypothetical protein
MATNDIIDTVVMSGGAPQSPLMAGFLYELLKHGKTFKNFHTSGAGALMALLLIAPKSGNPCRALRGWVEAGVADEIYTSLPVNFKLFHKPGPFAALYDMLAQRFKVPLKDGPNPPSEDPVKNVLAEWLANPGPKPAAQPTDRDALDRLQQRLLGMWTGKRDDDVYNALRAGTDPIKRLRDTWLTSWLTDDRQRRIYNDMVDLWFSAITPSTLTHKSKGLAAPIPFLEKLVCFETARKFGNDGHGHFCVNAYNVTLDASLKPEDRKNRDDRNDKVMWLFESPRVDPEIQAKELAPEHIRAAFSMPFIYPPARIGNDYFSEGADHQPINFHTLWEGGERAVVLLDVLGKLEDLLVRTPRDLWDAYVISIMTPVVSLAREDIHDFQKAKNVDPDTGGKGHGVELISADWDVPAEFQPYIMDWSYSNLDKLFQVGRTAGEVFLLGDGGDKCPHIDRLLNYEDVFGHQLPQCD